VATSFEDELRIFKSGLSEIDLLNFEAQGLVERVGVHILVARVNQNMTQKELARRAKDQGDISRIENGEIGATLLTLGRIFHVLNLDFSLPNPIQQTESLETSLKVKKEKKSANPDRNRKIAG